MVPGGVAPLPVGGARVIVDEAVARLGTLYCGTGRNDSTLEIETAALLRASGAGIAPLAKP
jgi:Cys-tRNA(Pro)/Cys-tRNA(Cys) deacylase